MHNFQSLICLLPDGVSGWLKGHPHPRWMIFLFIINGFSGSITVRNCTKPVHQGVGEPSWWVNPAWFTLPLAKIFHPGWDWPLNAFTEFSSCGGKMSKLAAIRNNFVISANDRYVNYLVVPITELRRFICCYGFIQEVSAVTLKHSRFQLT